MKNKPMTRGTDEAFLQLMTLSGSSILKLLGVPPKKAERYQFRAVNLKEKLFEPDLEGIPMLVSQDEPVFIEFQGYSDPFIRYRLVAEVFQGCAQQKYDGEVIAGIIYTKSEYKTAALPLKAFGEVSERMLNSFKEIVLTDYTEQELLAADPKLIVLAPFTLSTKTKKTTLFKKGQAWKNQIAQFFPNQQQREILDILGLFVLNRFRECSYKEVMAMLNFDLMDTLAGRQVYDMGHDKGLQKGLLNAEQEMIIEALKERFGAVSAKVSDQIHALDQQEELKELFRQALRCPDLNSFRKML
ncbi:hypothetical protein PN36_23410 [Candidatus Thiomargarita nelsonii]|uniref:Transposase (putative) YhgA-like domain-containing protein n=1 Tax=Candidatus Thiomargarita nelsonii TaxID=1003181 RepID=A0A0A6S149_9GAMM|nr:hypothetical protein PN36_23410 [Candidatus Thiomargarita nelsonii]